AVADILHEKNVGEVADELLENVAEINSYSTKYIDSKDDNKEKTYAGIDEDSNPGNCEPGTTSEYEDDTFACPALRLEVANAREMTGTVFLDNSKFSVGNSEDTHTGEERNGDGEYQDGTKEGETPEKTISGVKVQLYKNIEGNFNVWNTGGNDITGSASGTVVYLDENDNVIEDAEATDSSGKFKITDFIPGEYVIVYTWGENTYIQGDSGKPINVNDYKGTIYKDPLRVDDGTHQWYKENIANNSIKYWYRNNNDIRYSDAVDNYELRNNIDSGESDSSIMLSRTPVMRFGIEYADSVETEGKKSEWKDEKENKLTFNIPNVDFGITERARQEVAIDKRIESVKLTLANGQVILNATYNDTKGKLEVVTGTAKTVVQHGYNESKWHNGMLWAELDSELIQGAQLEVTYKIIVSNNSEIDYHSEEYYVYGPGYGEREDDLIKQKTSGVYDYLDKTMSFDSEKQETEIDVIKESDYKQNVTHELIEGYLKKYSYSETDENGVLRQIVGYDHYSDEWKKVIDECWKNSTTITEKLTESILSDKTILEIKALEGIELSPPKGENREDSTKSVLLYTSKVLTSTDEIAIDNDTEITRVERTPAAGRKVTITSSIVYNRGETVIITPPTGDDKNYLPYIILGITAFIILGAGVVFIKKKVLK
ncbi:MAG TPA: hypothetical protein DCE23_07730, partial [Firmicutes bacterium]|nr:hypothetical protein [Bacillota bacterium]